MSAIIDFNMAYTPIAEWEGEQYDFGEKNADWYWALGIIATAVAIVAVLFGNILLALVIIAGTATIAIQTKKTSRIHKFMVTDDGIVIDEKLYLFQNMMSFSILEYMDPTLPPALSIKTKHILSSHLLIPIHDHDPLHLYEYVASHVPEGNHERSFVDRLIERLKI